MQQIFDECLRRDLSSLRPEDRNRVSPSVGKKKRAIQKAALELERFFPLIYVMDCICPKGIPMKYSLQILGNC